VCVSVSFLVFSLSEDEAFGNTDYKKTNRPFSKCAGVVRITKKKKSAKACDRPARRAACRVTKRVRERRGKSQGALLLAHICTLTHHIYRVVR
jgi:hypothetical protein